MNSSSLGLPGKGVHFHICNIAVMDVIFTIMAAYAISKFSSVSFLMALICLFLLGIAMHRWFNVRTTVDKWLFP